MTWHLARVLLLVALASAGYVGERHHGVMGGALLLVCCACALASLRSRSERWRDLAPLAPAGFLLGFTLLYALDPAPRSPLYSFGLLSACSLGLCVALWPARALSRLARVAAGVSLALAVLFQACLAAEMLWDRLGQSEPYGFDPLPESSAAEAVARDPVLGYVHVPNFRGRFRHPEYGGEAYEINSDGFRDAEWPGEKAPDEIVILVLGDSTTAGFGARSEQTVPARLREELPGLAAGRPLRVLNAGVPGFSPRHEELVLQRYSERLRPDLVVCVLYDGNDLDDARQQFVLAREAGLHHDFLRSERMAREGWFERPELHALLGSQPTPALFGRTYWLRYSAFYRAFDFRLMSALARHGLAPIDSVYNNEMLRAMALEPDLEVRESSALVVQALERMQGACLAQGAPLLVVRLPTKLQCEPATLQELLVDLGQDPARFERSLPGRAVVEACRAGGIPALDLLPILEWDQGGASPWYYREGHPNPAGNERIAREIAAWVQAAGWLESAIGGGR